MDLCGYGEVAIHLGPLAIDHDHAQTSPLGLVLCECRVCIIGLEFLNRLEMGALLYGTHCAVL